MQLRASSGMALSVPHAEILSNKISITVREITMIDVLGSVIQLMTVEMLSTRIALPTTLVFAFELLVCVGLCRSSALSRRLIFVITVCVRFMILHRRDTSSIHIRTRRMTLAHRLGHGHTLNRIGMKASCSYERAFLDAPFPIHSCIHKDTRGSPPAY